MGSVIIIPKKKVNVNNGNSYCGDVVLDNVNMAYNNEESFVDKVYTKSK